MCTVCRTSSFFLSRFTSNAYFCIRFSHCSAKLLLNYASTLPHNEEKRQDEDEDEAKSGAAGQKGIAATSSRTPFLKGELTVSVIEARFRRGVFANTARKRQQRRAGAQSAATADGGGARSGGEGKQEQEQDEDEEEDLPESHVRFWGGKSVVPAQTASIRACVIPDPEGGLRSMCAENDALLLQQRTRGGGRKLSNEGSTGAGTSTSRSESGKRASDSGPSEADSSAAPQQQQQRPRSGSDRSVEGGPESAGAGEGEDEGEGAEGDCVSFFYDEAFKFVLSGQDPFLFCEVWDSAVAEKNDALMGR